MRNNKTYTIGIVGARGHVGQALIKIIRRHPCLTLGWVSSRQLKGKSVNSIIENATFQVHSQNSEFEGLIIEDLSPQQIANKKSDIVILALPNGLSAPYIETINNCQHTSIIIDLSADHRFDANWTYSVPEIDSINLIKARQRQLIKISNPGCYATAMQLALSPITNQIEPSVNCFGISGYSGAGTTPSQYNNSDNLEDNILPYALVEHLHEKEVSIRLNKTISFSPHVASFFRGINLTLQVKFNRMMTHERVYQIFAKYYQDHPLVKCQKYIPNIQQIVNTPKCFIGGFVVNSDGKRATIISCLDNLLKGAASQAVQNINIALGLKPTLGLIEHTDNETQFKRASSHSIKHSVTKC
jgi:N-acetyl-gamma-glutamyl-phosphate reductase